MDERKEYVRGMIQTATINRKLVRPKDGLMPTLFVYAKERLMLHGIMNVNPGDVAKGVDKVLEEESLAGTDVQQVSLICEAWRRKATKEEEETNKILGPRPSASPDREEIIACISVWPDGPSISGILPIDTKHGFRVFWEKYNDSQDFFGPVAEALRAW